MIDGVKIKRLKVIPDERGFLMEMLRCDDEFFKRFGQVYITGCKRGVAKAWHYHKKQVDHFVCVYGRALLVLYDCREDSPTRGKVDEFILEAPFPSEIRSQTSDISLNSIKDSGNILLKIPPMVMHGFTAIDGNETRIINIPNLPYNYTNPDEHRLPWDSEDVLYKWPKFVTKGG